MKKPLLFAAVSTLISLALPAQEMVVRLRMQPGDQALLVFSTARGPAVRLPGILGALRLDLNHLILVPAVPPDQFGFSVNRFPGAGALPPEVVHCQPFIANTSSARILPIFQPLVDELVTAAEQRLAPLGTAGLQGPFLFGLTRAELLALAQAYAPGPVQELRLLEEMRRPFVRAKNPDLARQIGLPNVLTVMYQEWNLMRQGAAAATIRAQQDTLITQLSNQWFDDRYPNGVPDDDEHWDLSTIGGPGASTCSDDVVVSNGTGWGSRRIQLTTELYRSTISGDYYIQGKGTVRAYVKRATWWSATPDYMYVSGTAQSSGNSSSLFDSCSDCSYVSDWSAYVRCTAGGPRVDTSAYARWDGIVTLSATGCDTTVN